MTSPRPRPRRCGFTLVELITTIAILGILSAVVAIFIRAPVDGYLDTVRRADMTDMADAALRYLGRDIRRAVPNSVRVSCAGANCYLEFLPSATGGRYRAAGEGTTQCAAATPTLYDTLYFTPDTDTCFEILGPPVTFTSGDQIVVANWGNPGSSAYEGNSSASHVRRAYAGATGAQQKVLLASSAALPLESPSKRFQVIAGAELAVTYACEGVGSTGGNGTLRRYWGYGIAATQPTSFSSGSSALLADSISSCAFNIGNQTTSNPYTRFGIVSVVLGVTRANESIGLYHEVHVDNLP